MKPGLQPPNSSKKSRTRGGRKHRLRRLIEEKIKLKVRLKSVDRRLREFHPQSGSTVDAVDFRIETHKVAEKIIANHYESINTRSGSKLDKLKLEV